MILPQDTWNVDQLGIRLWVNSDTDCCYISRVQLRGNEINRRRLSQKEVNSTIDCIETEYETITQMLAGGAMGIFIFVFIVLSCPENISD